MQSAAHLHEGVVHDLSCCRHGGVQWRTVAQLLCCCLLGCCLQTQNMLYIYWLGCCSFVFLHGVLALLLLQLSVLTQGSVSRPSTAAVLPKEPGFV
jgi:hypothetical protein